MCKKMFVRCSYDNSSRCLGKHAYHFAQTNNSTGFSSQYVFIYNRLNIVKKFTLTHLNCLMYCFIGVDICLKFTLLPLDNVIGYEA